MKKSAKNEQTFRPIFKRIGAITLSLGVIFLVSVPLAKQMKQGKLIDEQIKKLEEEINSMNSRNESLKKMIEFLESDEYAEEQARLQLGFKKEGEEVISVKGLDEKDGATNADPGNILEARVAKKEEPSETNPEKWRKYFLGNL